MNDSANPQRKQQYVSTITCLRMYYNYTPQDFLLFFKIFQLHLKIFMRLRLIGMRRPACTVSTDGYTCTVCLLYKSKILERQVLQHVIAALMSARRLLLLTYCSCPVGMCESCVNVSALLRSLECLFESSKNSRLMASAVGELRASQ